MLVYQVPGFVEHLAELGDEGRERGWAGGVGRVVDRGVEVADEGFEKGVRRGGEEEGVVLGSEDMPGGWSAGEGEGGEGRGWRAGVDRGGCTGGRRVAGDGHRGGLSCV